MNSVVISGGRKPLRCIFALLFLVGVSCFPQSVHSQGSGVPFIIPPLTPTGVMAGGPGFTLTVNGTNFVPASVVNWNGSPRATTYISSSLLTAAITAADITTPRYAQLTVVNPAANGGTSTQQGFLVGPVFSSNLTDANLPSVYPLIAGDFNGDGRLDLAETVPGLPEVCIQLGNGDGTFQAGQYFPINGVANVAVGTVLVAADFNGDGKLDLAALYDGGLSVLLGNGDGTFQPQKSYLTAPGDLILAAGDLRNDGKLDLIVGSTSPFGQGIPSIGILLGNGDGTFQNHVEYPLAAEAGQTYLYGMALGDFNGDGNIDVAVAVGGTVGFLPGNGDGTLQTLQMIESNSGVNWMSAADFNGDGKPDLFLTFAANPGSPGHAQVLMNIGGTFSGIDFGALDNRPTESLIADVDGDGIPDVVILYDNSNSISVSLGNGDGTFRGAALYPTFSGQYSGVLGDFKGDGKTDVIVSQVNNNSGVLEIFLQGSFPGTEVNPANLIFGTQSIGTANPPQAFTLTNIGQANLNISSIGIAGANPGDFTQNNNCGGAVSAGASCQINVSFAPTAEGTRNAVVSIADNAAGSPQTFPLTGTTAPAPSAVASPTSVTFPSQFVGTTGLPQTVTLMNTGTATLSITSVTATPGDFAPLSSCGNSLNAGSSCDIGVFFDPSVSGTRNGTLTISDNAQSTPQTVTLTGAGEDFSVASSSASTATISPGQTANYQIAVSPVGGFNQTVTLSCSGEPALSTCTVTPNMVVLNGSAAGTASVAVNVPSSAVIVNQKHEFPPTAELLRTALLLAGLLALVLTIRSPRNNHVRLAFSSTLLFFSIGIAMAACSSGGTNTTPPPPTQYTLTVTGTFTSGQTNIAHSTNLTLNLQQ